MMVSMATESILPFVAGGMVPVDVIAVMAVAGSFTGSSVTGVTSLSAVAVSAAAAT